MLAISLVADQKAGWSSIRMPVPVPLQRLVEAAIGGQRGTGNGAGFFPGEEGDGARDLELFGERRAGGPAA